MAPTERAVAGDVAAGARRRLLGLPVDAVSMDDAVARVAGALAERRRLRILVTNANKAWLAARDPELTRALEEAELVVAEWATAWAAGVLRCPGVRHIGGITLMQRLLAEAEAHGWSCYFLGGRAEVVSALVERLKRERPGLRIAGAHDGYLDDAAGAHVRAELQRVAPDLLFVAMGSPLQERWIMALPADGGRVSLGVGGSFDVLAGVKRDAPAWARGRGLEWAWRLAQDPRRLWKRYLVTNSWFVGRVLRERLSPARASQTAGGSPAVPAARPLK